MINHKLKNIFNLKLLKNRSLGDKTVELVTFVITYK